MFYHLHILVEEKIVLFLLKKLLPGEEDSKAFSMSLISQCRPEKQVSLLVAGTSKNSGLNVSCGVG